MADVLTDPFAVAAIVVVVAGLAKLRKPRVAVAALSELGVPAGTGSVRLLAVFEVALGIACLIGPGAVAAAALACCYAAFSLLSLLLARRRASCGCFGEGEAPASAEQSLISAALAAVCIGAAVQAPHDIGWLLAQSPGAAAVLVLGIAASAYATVLAYTQLPLVWGAWSAR